MPHNAILQACGLSETELTGGSMPVTTPIDGSEIARLHQHSPAEAEAMIARAREAFLAWREVPPPRRGELVRLARGGTAQGKK